MTRTTKRHGYKDELGGDAPTPLAFVEAEAETVDDTLPDTILTVHETSEAVEIEDQHVYDDAIKLYLRDIHQTALLSAEEERELALRIAAGDKSARNQMIVANLRLVVKIAKRYSNRGLALLDLIEEGNLGLIRAVERFDRDKECRFSTYATWWIRQAVERALINHSRNIRLPVHIADELSMIQKTIRQLAHDLHREPTADEIAAAMDAKPAHITQLLGIVQHTSSLDELRGDDHDYSLNDIIEDPGSVSPALLQENINSYAHISAALKDLTPTEQHILTLRFGLNDNDPQTLDAIGQQMGVTRERIRQIETKALAKLKKAHANRERNIV